MKKKEKNISSPLSDISIRSKFFLIEIIAVIAAVIMAVSSFSVMRKIRNEKYEESAVTIVTAADQLLEMTIESSVAIAGTIYTNSNLYAFLNEEYPSSSDYYNAYYQMQQNSPTAVADTNIVNKHMIYTSNPTILSGGNIASLNSAAGADWYKAFMKLNKPMILYCDPVSGELSLIRKLNYYVLDSGDSFIKIDLNTSFMKNYCDNLNFDGELYIISGNTLLYSSGSANKAEDIDITSDFEGYTKNYYTADIEYFAKAKRKSFSQVISGNWVFLFIFLAAAIAILILGFIFSSDIRSRVKITADTFHNDGNLSSLGDKKHGKDEVGQLLDICMSMSDRLTLRSNEYKRSSDNLMKKSTDYHELFTTAMRLDAELIMLENYNGLYKNDLPEDIPVSDELEITAEIAEKYGCKLHTVGSLSEEITVPAYSLSLAADNMLSSDIVPDVNIKYCDDSVEISFVSKVKPASAKILKLRAIFEDNEISSEYSFNHYYEYNPYLRLKHCLGSRVGIIISDDDNFTLTLTISK